MAFVRYLSDHLSFCTPWARSHTSHPSKGRLRKVSLQGYAKIERLIMAELHVSIPKASSISLEIELEYSRILLTLNNVPKAIGTNYDNPVTSHIR